MPAKPKTIDEYLDGVAPDRRVLLEKLRKTIGALVPAAEECISYGMPAFRVGGRGIAGFQATTKGPLVLPVQRSHARGARR